MLIGTPKLKHYEIIESKEGGGTEFIDQKFVCPPERGVTKIWPAGFTHTHHGVPAPTEDKFIITGWLSYIGS